MRRRVSLHFDPMKGERDDSLLSHNLGDMQKSELGTQTPPPREAGSLGAVAPHGILLPALQHSSRRAQQRCQTVRLIKFMNTAYKMQTLPSIWANIGTGNFLSNVNSREFK